MFFVFFFPFFLVNADLLLADREQLPRADRGVRHVPRRRRGAAAHPHAPPQLAAPGRQAPGPPNGSTLRKGIRYAAQRQPFLFVHHRVFTSGLADSVMFFLPFSYNVVRICSGLGILVRYVSKTFQSVEEKIWSPSALPRSADFDPLIESVVCPPHRLTGKDAAGIAMEAIGYARDCNIDVVMIDTAGRMQDNEPLMRALAKVPPKPPKSIDFCRVSFGSTGFFRRTELRPSPTWF